VFEWEILLIIRELSFNLKQKIFLKNHQFKIFKGKKMDFLLQMVDHLHLLHDFQVLHANVTLLTWKYYFLGFHQTNQGRYWKSFCTLRSSKSFFCLESLSTTRKKACSTLVITMLRSWDTKCTLMRLRANPVMTVPLKKYFFCLLIERQPFKCLR